MRTAMLVLTLLLGAILIYGVGFIAGAKFMYESM